MKPVTCYLERLSVQLHPSLEEFEEELLDLLNSDRLLQVLPVPSRPGRAQCAALVPAHGSQVGWKGPEEPCSFHLGCFLLCKPFARFTVN